MKKSIVYFCFFFIFWNGASKEKPSIQPKWLDYFSKELQKEKDEDAKGYGLLSTGGWVDAGQYFLILTKTKARFYQVKPATDQLSSSYELDPKQYSSQIQGLSELEHMQDYKIQVLDGLEYEFFALKKSKNTLLLTKKVLISQPDLKEDGVKHKKAIENFFELNKLLAAKKPISQ